MVVLFIEFRSEPCSHLNEWWKKWPYQRTSVNIARQKSISQGVRAPCFYRVVFMPKLSGFAAQNVSGIFRFSPRPLPPRRRRFPLASVSHPPRDLPLGPIHLSLSMSRFPRPESLLSWNVGLFFFLIFLFNFRAAFSVRWESLTFINNSEGTVDSATEKAMNGEESKTPKIIWNDKTISDRQWSITVFHSYDKT